MIGRNICDIRKKRGYTLSELAERADISKSYLSSIERDLNRNPSIQVMKKLATVLDVDLRTLLITGADQKAQEEIEIEWLDFVNELKESGGDKGEIQEYKTLIEFIRWQNKNIEAKK